MTPQSLILDSLLIIAGYTAAALLTAALIAVPIALAARFIHRKQNKTRNTNTKRKL